MDGRWSMNLRRLLSKCEQEVMWHKLREAHWNRQVGGGMNKICLWEVGGGEWEARVKDAYRFWVGQWEKGVTIFWKSELKTEKQIWKESRWVLSTWHFHHVVIMGPKTMSVGKYWAQYTPVLIWLSEFQMEQKPSGFFNSIIFGKTGH
jgi:hypothetical protein